jgi:hypothetical protein
MSVPRVEQAVIKAWLIGKQEQTLRVHIQSSQWIYILGEAEFRKRPLPGDIRSELAEHTEWFVECDDQFKKGSEGWRLQKRLRRTHGGAPCEKCFLSKREKLRLQLLLGDVRSDNLILHLAVLEEQEQRNRANIEFHSQVTGFIDVDLSNLRLSLDFTGELVEDWADHFTRATPLRPEVHEDGLVGVDYFGLKIRFVKVNCHGENLKPEWCRVKGWAQKNLCPHKSGSRNREKR